MPMDQMMKDTNGSKLNVIVLSYSGKPIFWRFGSENEILRTCGLIQALSASLAESRLGEMRSIRSRSLMIVFMKVGTISLVAVSKRRSNEESVLLLKMSLEYVYSEIIATLTDQVQQVLQQNANYDLAEALGASDVTIKKRLDEMDLQACPGPFLVGAVEPLFPIHPNVRENVSKVLQKVGDETENTVFAILLVGNRLLSIVQPDYLPHQLLSSDLRLLARCISSYAGAQELWFPVCLPRFNPTGFLHCYARCFYERAKLNIILVSQMNTTQQFQLFRRAANEIRNELGIPESAGSVIQVGESEPASTKSTASDIPWKRVECQNQSDSRKEKVAGGNKFDEDILWQCPLLMEIKAAASANMGPQRIKEYIGDHSKSLKHFILRKDASINTSSKESGKLSQCIISSSLDSTFNDANTKERLWNSYQSLCLKARLGASATSDIVWNFLDDDAIDGDRSQSSSGHTTTNCSAAMALVESIPNCSKITYITEDSELFISMNGPSFELYAAFASSLGVQKATSACAKLVRALLTDERKLFLTSPLTWTKL